MEIIWSHKIDEILKSGLYLENIGIRNWALTKNQALTMLEKFYDSNISILGGDVYQNKEGNIECNYDSWFCEPLLEEKKDEFLKRSIQLAITYIRKYRSDPSNEVLFVLVPKEQ